MLLGFVRRAQRREAGGEEPQRRGGAMMIFAQGDPGGDLFAVLYLQAVLGKDAFENGGELLPLAIVISRL